MKSELRKQLLAVRKKVEDKKLKDNSITDSLIACESFKNAKVILLYASLEDEISTDKCITFALEHGKSVALPVCTDKNGNMDYYLIDSLNQLKIGSFGVREPDISLCKKITCFDNSLCVVPGIAFDKSGFRLGYGKGYYDRFLSSVNIYSIGLCYDDLLIDNLPLNEYDIPVDLIITENKILKIS